TKDRQPAGGFKVVTWNSDTMNEVLRAKRELSNKLSGMTHEEILRFLDENRPEWAKDLPQITEGDINKDTLTSSQKG
ncbi:MAG: hypothetical protein KC940_01860, partial [Candidatus Omnitrophica bacterium]|nr:hypothetical protein [Candidatus Omnitrophota bacterium]